MNISKPLCATLIAIGLSGCGTPKCGSNDTKQVLDIALRNYLRTALVVTWSPFGTTYDSLQPDQKAAVDAKLDGIFPVVYSEIVEEAKTDKTVSCAAKVATKIDTHLAIQYKVNKTEDGYLQVRVEKAE